jgi:hypothetical protein
MSKHEGQIFEDDVRRVARALWPSTAFDGSTIFADRKRDGVFYGEFQINCIECTTDVTHKKAQIDLQKLKEIVSALRRKTLTPVFEAGSSLSRSRRLPKERPHLAIEG